MLLPIQTFLSSRTSVLAQEKKVAFKGTINWLPVSSYSLGCSVHTLHLPGHFNLPSIPLSETARKTNKKTKAWDPMKNSHRPFTPDRSGHPWTGLLSCAPSSQTEKHNHTSFSLDLLKAGMPSSLTLKGRIPNNSHRFTQQTQTNLRMKEVHLSVFCLRWVLIMSPQASLELTVWTQWTSNL